ncbi:MAG: OmpA family protein [Saprospiraceae bacterium]|nr:OmpA family protein [Saprospiraceae bacterium]
MRIWGGNQVCSRKELLDESPLINHSEWREYSFRFEPSMKHTYFFLEVFYKTPSLFPYNGNILIDDLGNIFPIPCEEKEIVEEEKNPPIVNITNPVNNGLETREQGFRFTADVANISRKSQLTFFVNGTETEIGFNVAMGSVTANLELEPGPNRLKLSARNKDGQNQESRTVNYIPPSQPVTAKPDFTPRVLTGLKDRSELSEGKKIPLNKMFFMADSSRIEVDNFPILDELFRFMMLNEDISIEVGGHTNNRCQVEFCQMLSEARAKSVVEYLVDKGIPEYRLKYKGYGKSEPIATNNTATGRKRNQRVEVTILKMEG